MEQTLPAAIVSAGDKIGRYSVLSKIATGGMAEVFLARQDGPMGFSKHVVLKRILPQFATDEDFLHMFLNEARLAAMINHPNVVSIYELGEDPSSQSLFMAMEYIDGRNLKDLLRRALSDGSQLPLRLSARLVADAAAGLDFAHNLRDTNGEKLNLVHRDISADNILVSYSGLVKVVDFGIAKAARSENRTRTGQVKGKFGYMAPEMLIGHSVDRRVDIWALGIVLYWLLTGRRPFRGENEGQLVNQVVNAEVPPMVRAGSPVPRELEAIVHKALQKEPEKRYQTAGELRTELELWLSRTGEPVTTATVAEVMEKLFPSSTDPERLAMANTLRSEARPSGWSNPGVRNRPSNPGENPQLTPGDGTPVSQVLASPFAPPQPRRLLAIGAAAGLLVALIGTLGVWLAVRPSRAPPAPIPVPVQQTTPPPTDVLAKLPPPPEPTPEEKPAAPTPLPLSAPSREREKETGHQVTGRPKRQTGHTTARPEAVTADTGGSTPAPAPTSGPPGKLTVDVRPWATVFVDGARVGMTPIDPLTLPSGKHKVELVNDEIGKKEVRLVEIKAGETTPLRVKLGD